MLWFGWGGKALQGATSLEEKEEILQCCLLFSEEDGNRDFTSIEDADQNGVLPGHDGLSAERKTSLPSSPPCQ